MSARTVHISDAPAPAGPYSQAVARGDMLFVSGQVPLDPGSGAVAGSTIDEQTARAIGNLKAVMSSQGFEMRTLVKTTVYLRDIGHLPAFNRIYESMLGDVRPARSVVAVSGLPRDVLVEIEAVACR